VIAATQLRFVTGLSQKQSQPDTTILDFARPPVAEVALAIQFDAPRIDTLDVAALRTRMKDKLPKSLEQPSRPPLEERFDEGPQSMPFRFEMLDALPMPRFWFLSEDDSRLAQVQHDLLAYNWRRMVDGAEYPHYRTLRADFVELLRAAEEILLDAGKSALRTNWCEVTYLNHVAAAPDGSTSLEEVVVLAGSLPEDSFLPPPEDAQLGARFRILNDEQPIGRLIVNALPAFRTSDARPIWSLNLTAKVRAAEPALNHALDALDLAHEWVVRGFRDVTTPRMHQEWGLREVAE